MHNFKVSDKLICVNDQPLPGNEKKPALLFAKEYEVKAVCVDSKGFQHLDVGLHSELNYIRSYETGEELPDGDKIHWCHPLRFKLKGGN